MRENYLERIENALNDIQKIQSMFRQRYGEECLADKEIEEVLKIAKAEHEEIQQYRAIGTVEECREARERQMGKKPVCRSAFTDGTMLPGCPVCFSKIDRGSLYCSGCGQKLDWSE